MRKQPFRQKKIKDLKEKARKLYREGLSTREVGKIVGRSHEWVAQAVKTLTAIDTTP